MSKILIVFTGGTIGSVEQDDTISVSADRQFLLLKMYDEVKIDDDVSFDTISPINILSENEEIEDWEKVVEGIKQTDLSRYSGIIITHGTDTIGYFSNAMSYMLNNINLPIVIVSSNLVLTNKEANGLSNFVSAVNFIRKSGDKGVFISYRNTDGCNYIHRGAKTKQIDELSENVYSINNEYYAKIIDGTIVKNDIEESVINNKYSNCAFYPKSSNILHIKAIVGQKYDLNIDDYRIIYHEMFHSGTIPKQAQELIKLCSSKNKLFFMGTALKQKTSLYEPTAEAVKEGGIILYNMSQEAAIIKLMMANGTFNTNEEIIQFMQDNIVVEKL